MKTYLKIYKAAVHNLKNVSLSLPKNELIVFTGLSGSGKSSLAFDTIYAEGQRRYVESLSSYARQFLERLEKPDVERIEGLAPAISIDQKTASHNPRSTVGTVTEIYDYLRLLFAHVGKPECPNCHQAIQNQSVEEIYQHVLNWADADELTLYSPQCFGKKGEHHDLFENIKKSGFNRVRINGEIFRLDEAITLNKHKKHNIDIVIDRLTSIANQKSRLFESIETALKFSDGFVYIESKEHKHLFSQKLSCSSCGFSYTEISPRLFSFNSPMGACKSCKGLGEIRDFDPQKVIPDSNVALRYATEKDVSLNYTTLGAQFENFSKKYGFDLDVSVEDLSSQNLQWLLYGKSDPDEYVTDDAFWDEWPGLIPYLRRRYQNTYSDKMRFFYHRLMSVKPCASCKSRRLNQQALSVKVAGKSIFDVGQLNIRDALNWFETLILSDQEKVVTEQVLKEIIGRLGFLNNVGLSYLSIGRKANTLSGGEAQRIRLATQIGSGLTGVLYVLDEPSIGLHQLDNDRLIDTLKYLRDLGNTLIVVEHDEDTIRAADYIVDIGPGAGRLGGEIVYEGKLKGLLSCTKSLTAHYLNQEKTISVSKKSDRLQSKKHLILKGASLNNLKNLDVSFPLGQFIAVTGVSGSGKSTLVNRSLYPALTNKRLKKGHGLFKQISGTQHVDNIIVIDQSPIGRTPRSNPATYVGAFSPIRELFSQTREAKLKGFNPGRFSFNTKGGRCESCSGDGALKVEMHFLADVFVTCDVCKGKRYNTQTLAVTYKGYTIFDVLDATVNQAVELFENVPTIFNKLKTLQDVGLGYIKLGQSATTLSGGEAQRVKLAKELSKRNTGKTLYLLDEPTTGLHFDDIAKLLTVLHTFVDQGNTVLVIEHNLDVIKTADHIIDLGPAGGDKGGQIVATGKPEEIAQCAQSHTGAYLKRLLSKD